MKRPSSSIGDCSAATLEAAVDVTWLIVVTQLMMNSDIPMMKASSEVRSRSVCRPSDGQTATAISTVNARKNGSAIETCGTVAVPDDVEVAPDQLADRPTGARPAPPATTLAAAARCAG